MLSSRAASAACAAALSLLLASCGGTAERAPQRHVVTIDATSFQPQDLTVAAGDTVVWVNEDLFSHTATATAGGFDSGEIPPGGSWSFTPQTAGSFPYLCTFHPTMTGTLRVR